MPKKYYYRVRHSNRHMSLNIEGCLKHYGKRKHIRFFDLPDGTQASNKEARAELNAALAKGHKLYPMSDECYRFDPFGKGCKGHIISLMPNDETLDKIELDYLLFKQGKRL